MATTQKKTEIIDRNIGANVIMYETFYVMHVWNVLNLYLRIMCVNQLFNKIQKYAKNIS
jgi:hypothetical protein